MGPPACINQASELNTSNLWFLKTPISIQIKSNPFFALLSSSVSIANLSRLVAGCSIEISRDIREYGSTLYVGLAHAFPPTNTKFKPLHLPTQMGMPYTNTLKHRTSYFKFTLTFLGAAKRWKLFPATRQKPEILAVLHHQHNNNI